MKNPFEMYRIITTPISILYDAMVLLIEISLNNEMSDLSQKLDYYLCDGLKNIGYGEVRQKAEEFEDLLNEIYQLVGTDKMDNLPINTMKQQDLFKLRAGAILTAYKVHPSDIMDFELPAEDKQSLIAKLIQLMINNDIEDVKESINEFYENVDKIVDEVRTKTQFK